MTRENKPEAATEARNDYAFWAIPGAAATVTYSLPLFHEIDFAVNEGYRKIPHGGIEEGGLLFGVLDEKGVRVDAFRPIACEHASGPSFLLSDRDLEVLHSQIENAASDPELAGLHVVGWFLAHTRSPLTLTDREADLCDNFFAHAGMLTVLVKPERFQPTRFGFLVRRKDGSLPRDGAANAIILPLPGRIVRSAAGPVPSIPAPALNSSSARRPAELDEYVAPLQEDEAAREDTLPLPAVSEPTPAPTAAAAATTTGSQKENRTARRQRRLSVEQVRPTQEEEGSEAPEVKEAVPAADLHEPAPGRMPALARRGRGGDLEPTGRAALAGERMSSERVLSRPSPREEHALETPDAYQQAEMLTQKRPVSPAARMVMVLPLAALLGCFAGWLLFLQVPPPIIPLTIKARGENVVVAWPPEQTRNAIYAAVRVDDSTPVPLTPEEKSTGRVEVQARPDMKVELIARNWIRDSRGIVHYVKPVANTAP
jgi:hypothetical protein